ncbi:MAG: hypothetical protein WA947_18770 [Phormidesmis sp.]
MATTMTTEVPSVKNDKIVGAFKTQDEANYVRSEIESAGISSKNLSVEGFIDPEAQIGAIGTTTGGEAGLLLGGLYGSFIGILAATSVPYWTDIAANSGSNRLLILGITAVGALIGWVAGKKELEGESVRQKQKSDPGIPRSFCVVVDGSPSEIDRARQVVEKSSAADIYGLAR